MRSALRAAGLWAFNAWFFLVFLVFSAVAIPALTLLVACVRVVTGSQRAALRRFRRAISWYGWVIVRVLVWPFIRVRYVDREPSWSRGASVFVFNHPSASDPFVLAVLPFELVQVAKSWPLRLPVLGRYARWAGYLDVSALSAAEFAERGAALLRDGVGICAFPEGTRSGDGPVGPFHGAVFRLAAEARAPIVPVLIAGNERMPPRGSLLLRTGVVTVTKLPAIPWESYRHLGPFELKMHVRDLLVAARAETVAGR